MENLKMETEKIQCAMKENYMDYLLESYNKLSEEIRREIRSSSVDIQQCCRFNVRNADIPETLMKQVKDKNSEIRGE